MWLEKISDTIIKNPWTKNVGKDHWKYYNQIISRNLLCM